MIVTVTLNPALDKSTLADQIVAEQKIRCQNPTYEPGGGGINVSRAIKQLGGESVAIYPVGGHTGILFTELMTETGIPTKTIPIKQKTRENFIVVNLQTNQQFRFGMPGPALETSEWQAVLHTLATMDPKPEYVVGSGSLSPGVPTDFYAQMAHICHTMGSKFVLDTSGEALAKAAQQGVFLLKPNLGELSELSGSGSLHTDDIPKAAKSVIASGKCEIVVVSMGPAGAMMVTKDTVEHVPAPPVHKKSTVGAGDSMVGGMTLALSKGWKLSDVLAFGVACGTAATMNYGAELCKKEDVDKLFEWILKNKNSK